MMIAASANPQPTTVVSCRVMTVSVASVADVRAVRAAEQYGVTGVIIGTALYNGAQLGPGPRDGLMTGLARRTGWSIRRIRTLIEVTVLAIGVLLGGVVGVGTLVFAFGVGPLTQFFLRHLVVRLDAPVAVAVEGETR